MNVLFDAAKGGAVLFSLKRPGGMHISCAPAAGVPWRLSALNRSGDEAGEVGLFAHAEEKEPSAFIVARQREEWFCVGTIEPRRLGKKFAGDEVLLALADLRGPQGIFDHAAIIAAPGSNADAQWLFVLVLFCGPRRRAEIAERRFAWEEAIRGVIARRLGADFQPDKIEPFPLHARLTKKGDVDVSWAQACYVRGSLSRRAKSDSFRLLGSMRDLMQEAR
jgi:hypothetical protein